MRSSLSCRKETRFYVLFPLFQENGSRKVAKPQRKTKKKAVEKSDDLSVSAYLLMLLQQGFSRLFRDGEMIELQKPEDYPFDDFEGTYALIDRLKADKEIRQRLVDSLEICFREAHAAKIVVPGSEFLVSSSSGKNQKLGTTNQEQVLKFSDKFICKYDGTVYEEPEPHLFSFNSPFGACPVCQGFGNTIGRRLRPRHTEPAAVDQGWRDRTVHAARSTLGLRRSCSSTLHPRGSRLLTVRRISTTTSRTRSSTATRVGVGSRDSSSGSRRRSTSCTSVSFSRSTAAIHDVPIATEHD
jgi:hypothetical protein